MRTQSLFAIVLLVAGCGGGAAGGDDDPPTDAATDAAPIPEGYIRLIGRTWNLQAGQQDIYRCVRFTVPQEMYVTNIEALAPLGTHHTVLSIASGPASGPDGEEDCSVFELGTQMLYASGVGTSRLDFPSGVGLKIAAGTQLHLNLHLYNSSDVQMGGDSAILVKAQSTPPPTLAEMIFAGTLDINIPEEQQPHTETGGCVLDRDYTLFALWPHMHKLAIHQKVELIRGGAPQILHDRIFKFAEQQYYLQTPEISMRRGDEIRVTCTWMNTTGMPIGFGDGSDKEMCFSGLYRYPAADAGLFSCTN